MSVQGAREQITQTVVSWPEVTAHPHRFGGTEYRLGRREIGHIHGDTMVDIPFPTKVRHQLVEAGRAEPHHILLDSGWVSFYIQQPQDINQATELLRESFELAAKQQARRQTRAEQQEAASQSVRQNNE